MKDAKEISVRALLKAIKDFNELEIMEPIEIPNKKRLTRKDIERLRDEFVDAIESLTEDEEELLPDSVVDMYHDIVADELEEEYDEEKVEVQAEEIPVGPAGQKAKEEFKQQSAKLRSSAIQVNIVKEKSKSEQKVKKGKGERLAFLETLIAEGKHTVEAIVEMYVKKFGTSPNTVKTYIYDGKNPKYCKFSKLVKIENGIVKFEE